LREFLRKAGRVVAGRLLPRIAYPVLKGPLKGARFVLGSLAGEGAGASVYLNQVERHQTAALVNVLRPGQIFFDIGANVGYYTLLGSRLVGLSGSVIAFEPVLRNLSCLHRHLILNDCQNVCVVTAACSDGSTLASFSAGSNFATGHMEASDGLQSRLDSGRWNLVPTVTVDSVANRSGASPDVIKIDVEGGELNVLRGAEAVLKTKHPRIFLSIHSDELRQTCLAFLRGFGYQASPLVPEEASPTEYLLA
jgi:FkbM family methyltransferase